MVLCLVLCLAGPVRAQDADIGAGVFARHCAVCHGEGAMGDGPLAPALASVPTDLTGLAAAAGGVFPTVQVLERIDGTDPLIPHGAPMPVFAEVLQGPMMVMDTASGGEATAPEMLVHLVAWLESIQK